MTKDEALKMALEALEGIVKANWRDWEELASPEEFERWVKARSNHIATTLRQALAEPPNSTTNFVEPESTQSQELFGKTERLELENKRLQEREWIGLTDAEIAEAVGSPLDEVYLADFRKVEAKLKEKNNA